VLLLVVGDADPATAIIDMSTMIASMRPALPAVTNS